MMPTLQLIKQDEIVHPINAFPEPLQEIINHFSEAKGYPHEYYITAVLGAFSTALGRSVTLSTGNYTAIGSVWAAIVGKKGFTKSEPQADAFRPIKKAQAVLYKRWMNERIEWEQFKIDNPKAKVAELPMHPIYVLNDVTPEALVITLANNPKGCGIVYDELAGFIGRFDRYKSGADEEMFLSLFNGDGINRTRVQSLSNAYIENSFLTIIGTIQPAVLRAVFFGKSESGFFDRWLICCPDNVKKQYPNQYGVDPNMEKRYSYYINKLLNFEYEDRDECLMTYTPESYRIINEYQCQIIDEENETLNDDYRGVLAKIEIYLHRFALLLQCIEFACSNDTNWNLIYKVSERSANGSVTLCKYFVSEAMKARILNPVEQLKDNWVDIYDALPNHGKSFDRLYFIKVCDKFGIAPRRADTFLKDNSDRSENKLFYKVKHGEYNKNLF